uniref:PiggyBac transposable element-derived protein domain-containing protein n=1 Tax=Esox lucius TaxID=8010 RepID=A0A6Q2X0X8_ESOLU
MASGRGKQPQKVFVGVEAVLEEIERFSDTDPESDASYDLVREDAFIEGEDPDWIPPSHAERPRHSSLSSSTPVRPTPTATPIRGRGRGRGRARARASTSQRGRSAQPSSSSSSNEESWHTETDADEDPVLFPFAPKRPPGTQLIRNAKYSPLELFQLFFTMDVIDTIIRNTNAYAAKRAELGKKFMWIPHVLKEFLCYIGILIYMGLINAKHLVDYWSTKDIYSFPFPRFAMSRARFLSISWNLHLCNLQEDEDNTRKMGSPGYDRLFKIKPLYGSIVSACKTYFQPQRQLSVDERMVASKTSTKLFFLADSLSAYTWNFYVYESVIRLLDFSLLGQGYHIFMDNFYTSPTLFLDLLTKKTLACGTIRTNRIGFPKTKINDLSRKAKRGEIRWLRNGKLLFVKWMDTREVTMCSTIHTAYSNDTVNRRVKNADGVWGRESIPIPKAVLEYNKYMGGVDVSDALIGYYNVLHKTKKWYKNFFFHFIDIAVVNSFILHSELAKANNKTHLTQKMFREELISELVKYSTVPTESAACSTPSTETCLPEYFGSDATAGRRICVLCKMEDKKVKTLIFCLKCNVALCMVSTRNCFKRWHTEGHNTFE